MASDLIVDDGLNEILKRMLGLVANSALWCAVGTGNAPPTGAETALDAESQRVVLSTISVVGNEATVKAFFNTAQGNGIVGEHGLFTAEAGGRMLDKGVEMPIQTKTSTQEMIVEKVITLTRG